MQMGMSVRTEVLQTRCHRQLLLFGNYLKAETLLSTFVPLLPGTQ